MDGRLGGLVCAFSDAQRAVSHDLWNLQQQIADRDSDADLRNPEWYFDRDLAERPDLQRAADDDRSYQPTDQEQGRR
jgi:hypothetical protein